MIPIPDCKSFNGYKPCHPYHNCLTEGCKEDNPIGKKILLINLDAMGDVIMTTSHLVSIKKKYPVSTLYWITDKISVPLLQNNPLIDKVLPYTFESVEHCKCIQFDAVMNLDKSHRAAALLTLTQSREKFGFGLNENGVIVPVNEGALYNYRLGLDDQLKFRVNTRLRRDYVAETLEIPYDPTNEYIFQFNAEEEHFIAAYRQKHGITQNDVVVGFNTGCSNLFPNKKMRVDQQQKLISILLEKKLPNLKIILLGGPEDTIRNEQIAKPFGDKILSTPTTEGLRRGICYEAIADLIITGDSFGMHLGIALKKHIVSWFGLSCQSEIDLYGRGIKLYPTDLECSPCWKKTCPHNLECISQIDLDAIIAETVRFYEERIRHQS